MTCNCGKQTRPAAIALLKMVDLAGRDGIASEYTPGVFIQGLLVYGKQGREIHRRNLDSDVCREAFNYSVEHKIPLIAFSENRCLTLFHHPLVDSLHTVYNEPKAEIMPSVEHLLSSGDVQKVLFLDTAEGVAGTLRPYWAEATTGRASVVQAQPDMLEIVPAGTSKGSGVRLLLDHFGVTPNEIMAIGDGENDIEMIELASLGIALSNGSEKTKAVANVIGVSNDEDGVADAIYSFIFIMLRIKTPKSHRVRRELEKQAPKLVEFGKKTLLLHGTKTSNVINAVLTEIYHLKKDTAVKMTKRNDNIRPFEAGGETSLEFYSLKNDCSLFLFGSHSKKRPHNLVIGRTYDHHIYDLVEVGVENFKSMESYSYDKKLSPLIGSKPFFAFMGEGFENVEELKHLKEVLLDLFRGQVVKSLNLAGLDRVYVCTALSATKVVFTQCALRLKKSGTIVPRMELVEVGPSMDLVVRRHRLPDESLKKQAMKIAPELTKKKEKNVSKDPIKGKIGKIYVPDQQFGSANLPFKPKGLKRERREAKADGEGNKHAEKKQKQQQDDAVST